jgi:hypothetical protein
MKIKITDTAKIDTALELAMGRAKTHAFTVGQIQLEAEEATKELMSLGFLKKELRGITTVIQSETPSSKAYRKACSNCLVTRVKLVYGASGWEVASIDKVSEYPGKNPRREYTVTQSQLEIANARRTAHVTAI